MRHPSDEDLAAYALGGLNPDEERSIGPHVDRCRRCGAELRALAPALGVLAESVEQHPPPPELRERMLSIVRDEAARAGEGFVAEDARPGPGRRRGLGSLLLRPAAGLAAVALAAAGLAGYLIADAGGGGEGARTVAVSSALSGAGGSLEIEEDGGTLTVQGMPALPKGAVYQVWVADGPALRPSAAFVPDPDGGATAAVPELAEGGTEVMVTDESRPGRGAPSGAPVLSARLD